MKLTLINLIIELNKVYTKILTLIKLANLNIKIVDTTMEILSKK